MNVALLRETIAGLQAELDKSRALAAAVPSAKAPVLFSDDIVATLISNLTALAGEADLHQTAFRKIFWRASQTGAQGIAALAIQFADLASAPPPT